jgi:hypothetical protein
VGVQVPPPAPHAHALARMEPCWLRTGPLRPALSPVLLGISAYERMQRFFPRRRGIVRSLLHFSDIRLPHVNFDIKHPSRHPGSYLRPSAAARLDPGGLLPTLDRARPSIRPSTGWLLPATCGVSLAASTTRPRTSYSLGALPARRSRPSCLLLAHTAVASRPSVQHARRLLAGFRTIPRLSEAPFPGVNVSEPALSASQHTRSGTFA